MKYIKIFEYTGDFAENKDRAQALRVSIIDPEIRRGEEVILDFKEVTSATQSFIHALISDVIRKHGVDTLDLILFKNCHKKVRGIIQIVVDYVQDGIFTEEKEEPKTEGLEDGGQLSLF